MLKHARESTEPVVTGRASQVILVFRVRLSDQNLSDYLASVGLLERDEPVRVLGAGDGNINFVRRVQLGEARTLVVKQAREALERFPEYTVTTERIVFEHRYGEEVAARAPDVAGVLPRELLFDEDARTLVMEDLGEGPRLDLRLANGDVPLDALRALGGYLGAVHAATRSSAGELAPRFANDEMRALHGEHIFTLPFEPNDFPISDALRAQADKDLRQPGVRERIRSLREHYYERADVLVHGDVQAGNVLLQGDRPRLLDAEIAHVGDAAFDLGSALAHLLVHGAAGALASRAEAGADALVGGYIGAGGLERDLGRARQFAGVEILRRSIGAARLPVLAGDAAASAAIELGIDLLAI